MKMPPAFSFLCVCLKDQQVIYFRTSPGWERKGTRGNQAQNGIRFILLTRDYASPQETVYTRTENID
jgi:hypothetical protein